MTKQRPKGRERPSRAALQQARLAGFQVDTLKRSLLEDHPLHADLAGAAARLPDVALPPLDGLLVEVPPPRAVLEADVSSVILARRALRAVREPRGRGAPVEAGDDVIVSYVGFEAGRPKPFAALRGVRLWEGSDAVPGMREGLVGCPVGESRTVRLELPYAVRVDAAFAVVAAAPVHDEARERAEAEARASAEARAERFVELQNRVIDAVRERVAVEVPADVVAASIHGYWLATEEPALVALGIPDEEQRASLAAWQADAGLQGDARRRVEASLLVSAFARQRQLSASLDDVIARSAQLLRDLRGTPEDMRRALAADPARARQAQQSALHMKAVEALTREVVGDAVVDGVLAGTWGVS